MFKGRETVELRPLNIAQPSDSKYFTWIILNHVEDKPDVDAYQTQVTLTDN